MLTPPPPPPPPPPPLPPGVGGPSPLGAPPPPSVFSMTVAKTDYAAKAKTLLETAKKADPALADAQIYKQLIIENNKKFDELVAQESELYRQYIETLAAKGFEKEPESQKSLETQFATIVFALEKMPNAMKEQINLLQALDKSLVDLKQQALNTARENNTLIAFSYKLAEELNCDGLAKEPIKAASVTSEVFFKDSVQVMALKSQLNTFFGVFSPVHKSTSTAPILEKNTWGFLEDQELTKSYLATFMPITNLKKNIETIRDLKMDASKSEQTLKEHQELQENAIKKMLEQIKHIRNDDRYGRVIANRTQVINQLDKWAIKGAGLSARETTEKALACLSEEAGKREQELQELVKKDIATVDKLLKNLDDPRIIEFFLKHETNLEKWGLSLDKSPDEIRTALAAFFNKAFDEKVTSVTQREYDIRAKLLMGATWIQAPRAWLENQLHFDLVDLSNGTLTLLKPWEEKDVFAAAAAKFKPRTDTTEIDTTESESDRDSVGTGVTTVSSFDSSAPEIILTDAGLKFQDGYRPTVTDQDRMRDFKEEWARIHSVKELAKRAHALGYKFTNMLTVTPSSETSTIETSVSLTSTSSLVADPTLTTTPAVSGASGAVEGAAGTLATSTPSTLTDIGSTISAKLVDLKGKFESPGSSGTPISPLSPIAATTAAYSPAVHPAGHGIVGMSEPVIYSSIVPKAALPAVVAGKALTVDEILALMPEQLLTLEIEPEKLATVAMSYIRKNPDSQQKIVEHLATYYVKNRDSLKKLESGLLEILLPVVKLKLSQRR